MVLAVYRAVTQISGPVVKAALSRRAKKGKEDVSRLNERYGIASLPRPNGSLIWLHCASVGESVSVLPLIDKMLSRDPTIDVLVTTGTVTSANLMAERLPDRAIHQYAPFDHPVYVKRFVEYWRPALAIWVESELWPNMLAETKRRCTPMILLNARISDRSFKSWSRFPRLAQSLLGQFDVCLAPDETTERRLSDLGVKHIERTGNLKYAASALPLDDAEFLRLKGQIGERPLWLAASTHEGEERAVARVHSDLRRRIPNLLSIIAPRHPERGPAVARSLTEMSLNAALRSADGAVHDATEIYVADTLGELGLLYSLSPIVFVGGSLVQHGGQNPLEPARLKCAILHGPFVSNHQQAFDDLARVGACIRVDGEEGLNVAIADLLTNPDQIVRLADRATQVGEKTEHIVDEIMTIISKYMMGVEIGSAKA
jgi:3-deoxy-D-manno-octulosonic-acid transferase